LKQPGFRTACRQAGFAVVRPSELTKLHHGEAADAA
jgi:hypothetical protein